MSHTLLLHVGMGKTGTTALQKFLFENTDMLDRFGWSYPILGDDEIGKQECSGMEILANGYYMYEALVLNYDRFKWEKGMKDALMHLKDKNVIISSERISAYGTAEFIAGVKEKYENVKVIIYLRREDRFIESIYNQEVKTNYGSNTFEEYIDSNDISKRYLAYLSKLNTISQIIGKENLIVRVYEKQQLIGNDTITDFLSILGIPLDQDDCRGSKSINSSIGGNYLEIKRLINSVQNDSSYSAYKDVMWSDSPHKDIYNVCTRLSGFYNKGKGERGFFTPDERKEFLEKYAAENEQIAREYLNRKDGVLFYDDRMDYPVYETGRYSSFEADTIRVLSSLIGLQGWQIRQMQKWYKAIVKKLLLKDILQKSKDKKLLFFGAGENCVKLLDIVEDFPVAMIADNDRAKDRTVLNTVPVRYAGAIVNWQDYFVVVTCGKTEEIEKQLDKIGLYKEEDYILAKEYGL